MFRPDTLLRSPVSSMQDRRMHLRVPAQVGVQYELPGGPRLDATTVDIGLGGTRLQSVRPPAAGSPLTLIARWPGCRDASRIPATVRWARQREFGVEFGLIAARDTHLIVEMMRLQLRSRPPSAPP